MTLDPVMGPRQVLLSGQPLETELLSCRNGFWRMIGDGSPSGAQDALLGGVQNNAGPYGSEPLSELEQAKRRLERLFES